MVFKKQKLAAHAAAFGCAALCVLAAMVLPLTPHAAANPMVVSISVAEDAQATAAAGSASASGSTSVEASGAVSGAASSLTLRVENPLVYDARRAMPQAEISKYDSVLRRLGASEGVDWRLLSAIAYHESRFRADAVSPLGARGLMQVRPVVARHFKVDVALLGDLETNVTLAAKLIRMVESKLKLPDDVAPEDRLSLVLACYNAGDGNVAAARRLAQQGGGDPNSWSSVQQFLRRGQTNAFVRKVLESYSSYCEMVAI